jgi:acetyltransferase-like isoleucine patch superfamily enzyme
VDENFSLISPFFTTGGENTRIGRNVFINQNCTNYDLGATACCPSAPPNR